MSNDSIGNRVRFLRLSKGLTMDELANQITHTKVTKATIGNLENDRNKPGIDLIIALSKFFGVSTDWILTGEEFQGERMQSLPHEELKLHYATTPEDKIRELEDSIKKLRSDLGLN